MKDGDTKAEPEQVKHNHEEDHSRELVIVSRRYSQYLRQQSVWIGMTLSIAKGGGPNKT